MKKILLLSILLGLSGCGENTQSEASQSNPTATSLQKNESVTPAANYGLAASSRTMSATAGPLQGWSITNSIVTGSSTIIDAIKNAKESFALVSPNAKQVAEVLRAGAAGLALNIAVEQLLGAVDWVMDPANNQIIYSIKPKDPMDPLLQYYYQIMIGSEVKKFISGAVSCDALRSYYLSVNVDVDFDIRYDQEANACKFYGGKNNYKGNIGALVLRKSNPFYNPEAKIEKKALSLEAVAEKVISNADAGSLDAQLATNIVVKNILNDEDQAQPVVDELERNAKKPPCVTISGKVVTVGTYGYRHDKVPPSKPHYPFTGDHYNLYRANQNPNNGKCFWVESGAADASNGKLPPPNSIPIEPFI